VTWTSNRFAGADRPRGGDAAEANTRDYLQRTFCFYVGSFLLFRGFPHEFSLAHRDNPQHFVVTFTNNIKVHTALRRFYWPLIQAMPGHRYYPTRDEVERYWELHENQSFGTRPADQLEAVEPPS
jgi:hypothetical protein